MGDNKIKGILREKVFTSRELSFAEQLGYSGGIFGNCMGQDSVGTWGDKFERDFMGINSPRMLIKGNVGTVISFFIPPVAGVWFDSPSRGKKSSLMRALQIMPIPFAISSLLLFIVPTNSALFNFFWALALGLLFAVADTFYDIAMGALGLKLCQNPDERAKFYTVVSFAGTLGSMLPGWIIPILVGLSKDPVKQQWMYFWVALIFCVLGVGTMYLPYFTVGAKAEESIALLEEKKAKNTQGAIQWNRQTLAAIFRNRPFFILQLSLIFDMIRQITYTALPYLYEDVFDDLPMKAIIDPISGGLSYVGLALVPFISRRVSPRNIMVGGYAYTGFFYIIMSLFNIGFDLTKIRKVRYFIGVLLGLAGMPNAAQGAARRIITADSTDYMEWYSFSKFGTPVRSDGLLTAAGNITSKIVALLKTNLYHGLFWLIKYQENTLSGGGRPVQTPQTLRGLYAVITLCGLLGNFLSAGAFLFDNYTGERRRRINDELNEFRERFAAESNDGAQINS